MTIQLDLFSRQETIGLQNARHYKKKLRDWPDDVWRYRHYRNSNGWSSARGNLIYAILLHDHGQMKDRDLARFQRFADRLERWEGRKP